MPGSNTQRNVAPSKEQCLRSLSSGLSPEATEMWLEKLWDALPVEERAALEAADLDTDKLKDRE